MCGATTRRWTRTAATPSAAREDWLSDRARVQTNNPRASSRSHRETTIMKAIISRLGIALLGLAAGLFATTASAQQFTMKVSFPTINDVTHEYFKAMKAGIEQRSGGRIKVDIYPANQL